MDATNTQQMPTCSVPPPSLLPVPRPAWTVKSTSLFKILLSAGRSQSKFVSPEIIMLHYPLVWAEHGLWDLNFPKSLAAR